MNTKLTHHLVISHMLLFFACLAWGGSYAVGRYGLNSGSAIWLTLWRWGSGALIFLTYLVITWPTISETIKSNWLKLIVISLLGIVIYPASLFLAVAHTTALNASLYLATTPVLITIASACVWREKVSGFNIIAIGLGIFGACVLLFRGNFQLFIDFRISTTDFWAVISAISWAAYCVSLPMKPRGLSEFQFLATIVVMGCAVLILAGMLIDNEKIPLPQNQTIAASMIYFAVFPSVLAFLAWNYATTNVGPAVASPYNNLVPLLGGVLGVIFLDEAIEKHHLIGGGIIIASLIMNGVRR